MYFYPRNPAEKQRDPTTLARPAWPLGDLR
jgi:hypothetical protein